MIIANEKKYIEEILSSKQKPKTISVKTLIRYVCKYYYDYCKDMTVDEYKRFILDILDSFDFSPLEFQEYKYAAYVRSNCKNLLSGLFPHDMRDVTSVSFTEDEITLINEAVYRKERKVLFTLYALAKIYSPALGWVNCSEVDIFNYANVRCSYKERLQILHSLIKDGLIEMNHMLDKTGYHVMLKPDSPIVLSTSRLDNFGNQYLAYMDNNLHVCSICGRLFKPQKSDECKCIKCLSL